MSMLGKIVLEGKEKNPRLIISEKGEYLKGLVLRKRTSECGDVDPYSYCKIALKDIEQFQDYHGKKIDQYRVADCCVCQAIYNLDIREIGVLKEETYCRVLRSYYEYQISFSKTPSSYELVKTEVDDQLVKFIQRGIYGTRK